MESSQNGVHSCPPEEDSLGSSLNTHLNYKPPLGCAVMAWAVLMSHMLALPLHPRLLALPPQSSHFPNNLYPRCHFTLHPSEILRQEHQPKLHPRHERLRTQGGFSPSYSCAWWTQDSGHLFHAPLASFSFPKSHDFLALLLRITTSGSMQTWNF